MILKFPKNKIGITQPFISGRHYGLDFGWFDQEDKTCEIYSPADGVITAIRNNYKTQDSSGSSYGNYVKIDHGDGIETLHAHLTYKSVCVKVGDKVKQGQKIGNMGTTGHSTGYHLHYEVRKNGVKVDPLLYTYAFPEQIVSDGTKRDYNIKYYTPTPEPTPTPTGEFDTYIVVNGDTLSKIAERYNTTYQYLAEINHIENPNLIYAGQELLVPKQEQHSEDFKEGDKVVPTRLVNYNGTSLTQYDDYYYITELVGDRAVLSALRNGKYIVWASMNIKDIKKV